MARFAAGERRRARRDQRDRGRHRRRQRHRDADRGRRPLRPLASSTSSAGGSAAASTSRTASSSPTPRAERRGARLEAVAASATASSSPRSTSACAARARCSAPASTGCRGSASRRLPEDAPTPARRRAPSLIALLRAARVARRARARAAARRGPAALRRRARRADRGVRCESSAGELGGRRLAAPRGRAIAADRPTGSARRSSRSSASRRRPRARPLRGTGALAIEALSRGAAAATLVDLDARPAAANVAALDSSDRVQVVRADALRFLRGDGRRPSTSSSATRPIDSPTALLPISTDSCRRGSLDGWPRDRRVRGVASRSMPRPAAARRAATTAQTAIRIHGAPR